MRGVELTRLFARIGGEHADQILVDKAEDIVALAAIHRDHLDKLNQLADGLGLLCGRVAKFAQAGFQSLEDALEEALVIRMNKAAKGRQGIAYMGDLEVATLLDPCRKQMFVGDEVTEVALDEVHGLRVVV